MIERTIENSIRQQLFSGKAIILFGPRQTGKTTLLKKIVEHFPSETLWFNGDDPIVQKILNRPNTQELKQILSTNKIIVIDEAQRIENIGLTSKIIVDEFPSKQLILSGSSSFELSQKTYEPLTGRKWTYSLWPISWEEWQNKSGILKAEQDLENRLVFGFYPDVLNNTIQSGSILQELSDSYLYKDILMYANIKKPDLIKKLLQAISYQLGNEVSYRELGETTGIDSKTVNHYIDILEKAFVIIRLKAFSKNLRNEIKANQKIYFIDNGIRNAVIGNLNPLSVRQDVGPLWENFLISERFKQLHYKKIQANSYFWRSTQQQEIDYIEERNGVLCAYEFKWNNKRNIHFSKTFTSNYNSINKGVTRENFKDFVLIT